jgi:hypothetical protein
VDPKQRIRLQHPRRRETTRIKCLEAEFRNQADHDRLARLLGGCRFPATKDVPDGEEV